MEEKKDTRIKVPVREEEMTPAARVKILEAAKEAGERVSRTPSGKGNTRA